MSVGLLRLRPVRDGDEEAVLRAQSAMAADGFSFAIDYEPGMPWSDYVARLEDHRAGRGLADGLVPATFLLADVEGTIVGRVSIRHRLNEHLLMLGGHIGYGVLPEHRRRGHATEMLRQGVVIARSLGADRVLVTCDDDNEASARTIERCGGELENVVDDPHGGVPKRRYWIG